MINKITVYVPRVIFHTDDVSAFEILSPHFAFVSAGTFKIYLTTQRLVGFFLNARDGEQMFISLRCIAD